MPVSVCVSFVCTRVYIGCSIKKLLEGNSIDTRVETSKAISRFCGRIKMMPRDSVFVCISVFVCARARACVCVCIELSFCSATPLVLSVRAQFIPLVFSLRKLTSLRVLRRYR